MQPKICPQCNTPCVCRCPMCGSEQKPPTLAELKELMIELDRQMMLDYLRTPETPSEPTEDE